MLIVTIRILLMLLMTILGSSRLIDDRYDPSKNCKYSTGRNLLKATCYNIKLQEIPSSLRSEIQFLDVRDNKIGRLHNDSLSRYTELRELYLQSCGMAVIEQQAFAHASRQLEVLDLSDNQLRDLPVASILELPILRKLYLGANMLENGVLDLKKEKSKDEGTENEEKEEEKMIVTARLELLDLSDNKLTQLPRLGMLPELQILNVSGNKFTRLPHVNDLARLCSLRRFDFGRNNIKFNKSEHCECYQLRRWIQLRSIWLDHPLDCPNQSLCSDDEFHNHTNSLFTKCLIAKERRFRANQSSWLKIWLAGCLAILVLVSAATFYYFFQRKESEDVAITNSIDKIPT